LFEEGKRKSLGGEPEEVQERAAGGGEGRVCTKAGSE